MNKGSFSYSGFANCIICEAALFIKKKEATQASDFPVLETALSC